MHPYGGMDGSLYERAARAYCRRRGYRLLARNLRRAGGEIDLLARARDGAIVILEVRGRGTRAYLPRHVLSPAKRARLARIARTLEREYRSTVRMELVEIVGHPRRGMGWLVAWVPELAGLETTVLAIE